MADPRVSAIAERAEQPLRVAVCGRRGVGRGTVARALGCAGVAVAPASAADVVVYVLAEVVKPEDIEETAAARLPVLVVLNKADVGGGVSCAEVSALTGAPAVPLSGRLAGGLDAVLAGIQSVGAEVRYRRLLDLVAELEAWAVSDADGRIGAFLAGDAVVSARMAAAVEVIEAAGLDVDPPDAEADDAAAHLRRATAWQRYGRGPVATVHRACAHDITRASLRRWSRAGAAR